MKQRKGMLQTLRNEASRKNDRVIVDRQVKMALECARRMDFLNELGRRTGRCANGVQGEEEKSQV